MSEVGKITEVPVPLDELPRMHPTECRECVRTRRIVTEVVADHPAIKYIAGKP